MKTIIRKIDQDNIDPKAIAEAAAFLQLGETVAFPTETVYGLGADALNPQAVDKIFAAKGRPGDNPLIVHVADLQGLEKVAFSNPLVEKLAKVFWPGPLTMVLPKKDIVPANVCAGLPTVGIRMPVHPVALALLRQSGLPIAAPSANTSSRPSPTQASHVIEDLAGKIAMILDSGEVEIGLESTVLDLSSNQPAILRPGRITAEDLQPYLGFVPYAKGSSQKPASPGMKYAHYAPQGQVVLAENLSDILEILSHSGESRVLIIATRENCLLLEDKILPGQHLYPIAAKDDLESFAHNIFAAFRHGDEEKATLIIVEKVPQEGLGIAIMNRLEKAAGSRQL